MKYSVRRTVMCDFLLITYYFDVYFLVGVAQVGVAIILLKYVKYIINYYKSVAYNELSVHRSWFSSMQDFFR